jgi:hypothetical protein
LLLHNFRQFGTTSRPIICLSNRMMRIIRILYPDFPRSPTTKSSTHSTCLADSIISPRSSQRKLAYNLTQMFNPEGQPPNVRIRQNLHEAVDV